jgi:glycerophosphoryl diester phosphodiesterase
VLLLGHRGARHYAPENTLEAFELALEHGCDGFEFDLRRSGDNHAVVWHNPRLARHEVVRTPYTQLRKLSSTLVTITEVLERFAGRAYLYIELKTAGLEDELLTALAAHPPQHGFVIASFYPEILCAVHLRSPATPLGFNCYDPRLLPQWRSLPVNTVMPHWRLASERLIDQVHASGKDIFVWTVNRRRQMKKLAEFGVDALLSDDTELLVQTLRPSAS